MGRTETATFCPNEVAADDEAEPKTATFCPNEVGADDKTCAENGVRKSGPVCRSPDILGIDEVAAEILGIDDEIKFGTASAEILDLLDLALLGLGGTTFAI